jgi:short-subunit dehydrogenase
MHADDRSRTARRALIAGASSGIGAAFAERLGVEGYDLVLIARRLDRLEALAHEIEGASGVSAEAVVADLVQPHDLRLVEERIAQDDALELLVNCAGFAVLSPFHLTDPAVLEAMIRLHTVAPMRLTHAALPGMRARERGSIINVASSGAFLANPGSIWNTYAATKAFVLTFTEGLHEDLRGTGVHVQVLCPGWTRTEILESAGRPWDKPGEVTMTPEQVVEASLDGLRRGELICCPGLHDEALLLRLNQAKDAIFNEMMTNGTLARRYLRA